jgi:hypothetical protein
MGSNGTDVAPENRPALETPNREPVADDQAKDRLNRARLWVALAGILAGVVAFGIGEMVYGLFPAANEEVNTMGRLLMVPTVKTTIVADTRNGALTFGLLGVCLGGMLGIAGGLARRSASAMCAAGLLGSVLGLAAGTGVSFAVLPVFFRVQPIYPQYEMFLSMGMHGSIWGLTGAAGGLAFAVGLGKPRVYGRAVAAGFVGAVLGAVVFDLIGAVLLPFGTTGDPISSTWPTRLMARLLVTLATAAVVILLLPEPRLDKPLRSPAIAPPAE